MAVNPLKPEKIADLGINLLKLEVVTPQLFWKVADGNFVKTANDTLTIRVPSYGVANERTMRSGTSISMSDLYERGVDVTIDTHIYHATSLTSESLTLDITDFGSEVLRPQAEAVARGLEGLAVDTITGADYADSHRLEWNFANPQASVLRARRVLNGSHVPQEGRYLVVGAGIEENLLSSELLTRADQSGSTSALRSATIGDLRGFTVVTNPNLPDNVAVAMHRSAFALVTRAPARPRGASFGATAASDGFALRWLCDYDNGLLADRSLVDIFAGSAVVTDNGTWADGRFTPAVEPDSGDNEDMFVRAVLLTGDESA